MLSDCKAERAAEFVRIESMEVLLSEITKLRG